MKLTLPLLNPASSAVLPAELVSKLDKGCQLFIVKHEASWEDDDQAHVFSVWIEYGRDQEECLIFDASLDDLELFANTLLKSIEMLRRDYSDVIKEKIKKGALL